MKEILDKLTEIQVDIAIIQENTKHISSTVAENSKSVKSLHSFANKLKGLGFVTGLLGVIATFYKFKG